MQVGRSGEDLIENYLIKKFGNSNVKRLTNDPAFFNMDIDFQVIYNGKSYYIELKTDSHIHRTQNIPFEFARIYYDGFSMYEGWGFRSKATNLLIKEYGSSIVYYFDFSRLREDVKKYLKKVNNQVRVIQTLSNVDDLLFDSVCEQKQKLTFSLLIPLDEVWHKKIDLDSSLKGGDAI